MMTTRQFYFSGLTGGFLMVAGAGLISVGVAGGGLFLVGAAISVLAIVFRFQGRPAPALQRITINGSRDNRSEPVLNS